MVGGRRARQCFLFSVPVSTLASGPLHNYSSLQNDPCYLIENELFDVESRLKRCPPSSKGRR